MKLLLNFNPFVFGARNVALIYTPLSEYDLTVTKSLKSNQPANQTHSQNHLSAIKNIKKGEEEKVNSLVEAKTGSCVLESSLNYSYWMELINLEFGKPQF